MDVLTLDQVRDPTDLVIKLLVDVGVNDGQQVLEDLLLVDHVVLGVDKVLEVFVALPLTAFSARKLVVVEFE